MKINVGDADSSPLLNSPLNRTLRDRTSWFLAYLFLALVVNVLGIVLPVCYLIRHDYTAQGQILNGSNIFGIIWFLFSVTVGPFLIGLTLIELSRSKLANGPGASAIAVLIGLACAAAIIPAWIKMIEPQMTFVSEPYDDLYPADQVLQFLGGFITVIYPFVAIMCFVVAAKLSRRGHRSSRAASYAKAYDSAGRKWRGALVLAVLGATLWLCTTIFSGTWNYGTSYFGGVSQWNIGGDTVWRFGPSPTNETSAYLADPVIVLKVYEDVCVFYGVVLGVAMLSVVALSRSDVRRVLHRRVAVIPGMPAVLADWGQGYAIGEVLVLACVIALYAYNFYYWAYGFTYIEQAIAIMGDPYPLIQKWARVAGHMSTLTMSFLLLPAARNSVWESCFGIPFERFVKYHRMLGRWCWLTVTLHMILFQIKWAYEGLLWNNVFTIDNLLITNYNATREPTDPTPNLHADNWTIPVVEAAWLVLTIVLIVAQVCRRYSYELFQYTHYFTWFFFISTLLHAWTHWYYVALGMFLYFFDKLTRVVRSCNEARLVSLSYAAGVSRVEVSASSLGCDVHDAGQYAFLNIPAISQFQWHPFTISSAPYSGLRDSGPTDPDTITFHIKDMGPGTWTGQLAELARSRQSRKSQTTGDIADEIAVGVDGPYGHPPPYREKDTVILVAGGIGITPFHALLSDLHAQSNGPSSRVREVHLIWAARDADLVALFASTWASLLRSDASSSVHYTLHLHCTARGDVNLPDLHFDGLGDDDLALVKRHLLADRPAIASIFGEICTEVAKSGGSVRDRVIAMVCGPRGMIEEVSSLASRYGTDFFSEVFTF